MNVALASNLCVGDGISRSSGERSCCMVGVFTGEGV